jgi:hypothetical protein
MTLTLLAWSAEVSFDQPVITRLTRRDPIALEKHIRDLSYACRAGAYHGAVKSQHGSLPYGIHYYGESKK